MSAYQAPIPPMSSPVPPSPRQGGYDRYGNPQDVVTGHVTAHHGAPLPPPHVSAASGRALPHRKSVLLAVFLAAVFGPFGLLYSSFLGAAVTSAVLLGLLFLTLPLALLVGAGPWLAFALTVPLCMLWAALATAGHNGAVTLAQHLVGAPRR